MPTHRKKEPRLEPPPAAATREKSAEGRLWTVVLGVWAVAFCLRCLYVWQIERVAFFDIRIGDGEAYHLWARRIADGDWLGKDVFYQAPLYPYVLAVFYRTAGDSATAVRLFQAFIGAGSCMLLAIAGTSLFGRLGAIAGLGLAIYPPAIFLDGLIDKSSLVTFFTSALLAISALAPERMTMRRWFGAGMILGLLALTRENALILLAPILAWIMFAAFMNAGRARFAPALLFTAGCALVLLPVGLRNMAVGGEFHLTTSQFGPNFYIGNHAGARGTYEGIVAGHGSVADEREDATRLAEKAVGRRLSPGEVSSYWAERSFAYIQSQPIDWLKLLARKLALTFNSVELSDTESQDVYAASAWILRIFQPFDFGLLLGMAALGIVLTGGSWRRLWFLYAIGGAYALSVALFYVFARYRFPLVPVLMLLAGGGIVTTIDLVRQRRFQRLAAPAGAALFAILFAHLSLDDGRTASATHYLSIAIALSKDPARAEDALGFYQRALDQDPKFPAAHLGLGAVLARIGKHDEAIAHYRAAIALWPDYGEAHYNLGMALAAAGRQQEAELEYREALRLRPDDPDTRFALGKTLTILNKPDLALEQFQRGLASSPNEVKSIVGLGVVLTQLGRPDEAIRQYELALKLDPDNAAAHNNLGWTLASQGRVAEAVPHFERALAFDPNYANAKQNLEEARRVLSRRR